MVKSSKVLAASFNSNRSTTPTISFPALLLRMKENAKYITTATIRISKISRTSTDVISIHTFDYDDASHAFGPESKQALNALALEAEGFHRLAEALEQFRGQHRILMTYSPDHGQHSTKSDDAEEVHVDTIDLSGFVGLHGSKMIEDMNILHFFGTI